MALQSRRIYQTGNAALDMALADIAKRLDTLEGLRPELTSGFAQLDGSGNIATSAISGLTHGNEVDQPASGVHGVDGYIVGTSDTQTITNKNFGGVTQYATFSATGELSIYDENGDLIHKMS